MASVAGTAGSVEPPPVPVRLMASCGGAFLTSFFTTPFDAVKVRLQLQRTPSTSGFGRVLGQGPWQDSALRCCGAHECVTLTRCANPQNIHFNGLVDAFVKIARHEGPTALWRGLSPTLLMSVPTTMVYFTGYDQLTFYLRSGWPLHVPDPLVPAVAGSCARVGAATLMGPLELVRTRIQSAAEPLSLSLRQYVAAIVRNEGVLALWRGVGPTLWRDVPFSALYWTVVGDITARLRSRRTGPDSAWHSFKVAFLAGAGAGFVSTLLTNPFDVAKTRVQAVEGASGGATFRLLASIYRTEGAAGLMRGFIPRVVRIVPACAIMIASYELGKYCYYSQISQL